MAEISKKYNLSRKVTKAISNRFVDADKDGSETLDFDEFLNAVDLQDSRLSKNLFNTIDKRENLDAKTGQEGKDGRVSFKEFAEEMARIDSMNDEQRIKWTFSVYDKNKNGFLDLDEIMQAMNDVNVGIKFSSDRLKAIFHSRACRNPNKITSPEFCLQCKKHEILEMPVRLLYSKVKAHVFDYDDTVDEDEFKVEADQKQRRAYNEEREAIFLKDAEQREKKAAQDKACGKATGKKVKNVKMKKAADGSVYEDSD